MRRAARARAAAAPALLVGRPAPPAPSADAARRAARPGARPPPLADAGACDVGARTTLLEALFHSADALAARNLDIIPARHALDAFVGVLLDELTAAAALATAGTPFGAPRDAVVGRVRLPPATPPGVAAAALAPLLAADAGHLCFVLDFVGNRGGGAGGRLLAPWLVAPLDAAAESDGATASPLTLPLAVRARALHTLASILQTAPRTPSAADTGRAAALAEWVAAKAVPPLERAVAAEFPRRRDALASAPGGTSADVDRSVTLIPTGASPAKLVAVLAHAHAWLVTAGGVGLPPAPRAPTLTTITPALASILDRAAAPYGLDVLLRNPLVGSPYRGLALRYVASALAGAPSLGTTRADAAALARVWLAGALDAGVARPLAALAAALAGCGGAPAELVATVPPHTAAALADGHGAHAAARARRSGGRHVCRAGGEARTRHRRRRAGRRAGRGGGAARRRDARARVARRWRAATAPLLAAGVAAASGHGPAVTQGAHGARPTVVAAALRCASLAADAAAAAADADAAAAATRGDAPARPACADAVADAGDELAGGGYADAVRGAVAGAAAVAARGGGAAATDARSILWALTDAATAVPRGAAATTAVTAAVAVAALVDAVGVAGAPRAWDAAPRAVRDTMHALVCGPLRASLRCAHVDAASVAASGGAARLVGALLLAWAVVEGGGGGEGAAPDDAPPPPAWLRALLPPVLAPLVEALCPASGDAGGDAPPVPGRSAAVFEVASDLVAAASARGAPAATAALLPRAPPHAPPPPPTSTIPFAGGPLQTGDPVPADRVAGALHEWWLAAVGAAVAAVALSARVPPSSLDATTPTPPLTPARARAVRSSLQTLLGAPRAVEAPPAGAATPPPSRVRADRARAAAAATPADAAVAGLTLLERLARAGPVCVPWAAAGLVTARAAAAAPTAPTSVRAAFDAAVAALGWGGGVLPVGSAMVPVPFAEEEAAEVKVHASPPPRPPPPQQPPQPQAAPPPPPPAQARERGRGTPPVATAAHAVRLAGRGRRDAVHARVRASLHPPPLGGRVGPPPRHHAGRRHADPAAHG